MLQEEFKKKKDNEGAKETNVEREDKERNRIYARSVINLD